MKSKIFIALLSLLTFLGVEQVHAQHTFGATMGIGMGSARLEPVKEMKGVWGLWSAGLSWRYYSKQRVIGGFGIDLEFMQQGFSYAQNASYEEDKSKYKYYERRVNSIMLPIVWQPHVYLFRHRLRFYIEAAATFSYNISSRYKNDNYPDRGWQDYEMKTVRDNRFGYGLAAGTGLAVLIKRVEINLRVRYYLGYSDIVKNRNKYADNTTDDKAENPFSMTPLRSPLDNLNISIGISYRFNKGGFEAWKPRPKRVKNKEVFHYGH